MHPSNAFLHDSLHVPEHVRVLLYDGVGQVPPVVKDHVGLPRFPTLVARGTGDAAVDAPPEVLLLFPLPREYRVSWKVVKFLGMFDIKKIFKLFLYKSNKIKTTLQ